MCHISETIKWHFYNQPVSDVFPNRLNLRERGKRSPFTDRLAVRNHLSLLCLAPLSLEAGTAHHRLEPEGEYKAQPPRNLEFHSPSNSQTPVLDLVTRLWSMHLIQLAPALPWLLILALIPNRTVPWIPHWIQRLPVSLPWVFSSLILLLPEPTRHSNTEPPNKIHRSPLGIT